MSKFNKQEYQKEYDKKYKKENKEKILKYNQNRKEYHKQYTDKWRLSNPEKVASYKQNPKNRYSKHLWFCNKIKREFTLTFEDYLQLINKPCYYCNTSLEKESGIGLDRVDNNKGYTKENVLPCCGFCNKVRSNIFTVEETLLLIRFILKMFLKTRK